MDLISPFKPRAASRAGGWAIRGGAGVRWWVGLLALWLCGGCTITVYQPMTGFHQPVVVDPQLPNFQDTHLDLHCVPGEVLNHERAGLLCQKVGQLFENQGAKVRTHLAASRTEDEEEPPDPTRTALSVELRSRSVHADTRPVSWLLCALTLTLLPGISETTFAQEVVIRDDSGFLLVSDVLEGRILTRFGAGAFAGNAIADIWKHDDDKLTGKVAHAALSADLYGQLSQLVFNARVHSQVLNGGPPEPAADALELPALGELPGLDP